MKSEIMQVLNWLKDQDVDFSKISKSMLLDARPSKKLSRLMEIAFLDMRAYLRLGNAVKSGITDKAIDDLTKEMHNDYAIDKDTAKTVIECIAEVAGFCEPQNSTPTLSSKLAQRIREFEAMFFDEVEQKPSKPTYKIGDVIDFGVYKWHVLDRKSNSALIITEDIIDQRVYHEKSKKTTWAKCDLRKYLNNTFLDNFSAFEISRIIQYENSNDANPRFGTSGGANTTDRVFLLSLAEVCRYFGDSTANLRKKGSTRGTFHINDENNSKRMSKLNDEALWWWLRSPGFDCGCAAYIDRVGSVDVDGSIVSDFHGGVRPTLWLKLNS